MSENRSKKTGNPSGFKDTLPGDKLLFDKLMAVLSQVVESYGFAPIDTPEIEWMDTLTGHDDSGGKLIYRTFNGYEIPDSVEELEASLDKGLRFDLTVPLARFFGQYENELPLPFRRYQWGKVFRGESAATGKGRYREFYQFDADIIGASGTLAEVEMAAMMADTLGKLNLPAVVKVNNRKLLDGLVEIGKIEDQKVKTAIFTAIDKFDKIGLEKVLIEVKQVSNDEFAQLVRNYLVVSGTNQEKLAQLEELLRSSRIAAEGLRSLDEIIGILEKSGYGKQVEVSPEIVRGLGYYTGVIFEAFVQGYENYGSMVSGGRYDRLIADLGGPNQPAVGVSFGVSRLLDVLKNFGWTGQVQTLAKVLIVNFSPELNETYFSLATNLRKNNIPAQVFSEDKKLGKQLSYASDLKIPFAVLIGPDEKKKGTAIVRSIMTREQQEVQLNEVVETLKKSLT